MMNFTRRVSLIRGVSIHERRDCIRWPIRTCKAGGATARPISGTGSGEQQ